MIKALIADDEKAVATIIEHFINTENMPIEIIGRAENGAEAVRLIKKEKPQLVFLDIQMPVMNGFEVMQDQPNVKYIIITAFESFDYAQKALRLGASDILLKPVEKSQLLQAVSRTVGWSFTANDTVNGILEYISEHFAEKISLDDLANMFYATPSHIARLFRKYMDTTIIKYLNKVRIEKACLLMDEGHSVKETAETVGYESLNNFYRYFEQQVGMTPASYSNKNREK